MRPAGNLSTTRVCYELAPLRRARTSPPEPSPMLHKFAVGIGARMRLVFVRSAGRRMLVREDGAVAVEFAFVAAPFLALLFAILETGLVFFANQTLETVIADSGRFIMTGQAAGMDLTAFKN